MREKLLNASARLKNIRVGQLHNKLPPSSFCFQLYALALILVGFCLHIVEILPSSSTQRRLLPLHLKTKGFFGLINYC